MAANRYLSLLLCFVVLAGCATTPPAEDPQLPPWGPVETRPVDFTPDSLRSLLRGDPTELETLQGGSDRHRLYFPTRSDDDRVFFEHTSRHYRVLSDLDPEIGQQLPRDLEALLQGTWQEIGAALDFPPERHWPRFEVVVFAHRSRFHWVTRSFRHVGELDHSRGFYDTRSGILFLFWHPPPQSNREDQVLLHEASHQILHQLLDLGPRTAPLWLLEGWAAYLETVEWEPAAGPDALPRARFGAVHRTHLKTADSLVASASSGLLERFLEQSRELFLGGARLSRAYRNYALSWSLIHYLLESEPQRQRDFYRFLQVGFQIGDFESAFETELRRPEILEPGWREHVRRLADEVLD